MKFLTGFLVALMLVTSSPAYAQMSGGLKTGTTDVESTSEQETSFMYEGAISIFMQVETFATEVGGLLAGTLVGLIMFLYVAYLLVIGTQSLIKEENPIPHFLVVSAFMVFVSLLVVSPLFNSILGYIMGMTTSISSTIMDFSLDFIGASRPNTGNTLGDTFKATENLQMQLNLITDAYNEKYDGFFSFDIVLTAQILLCRLIFLIINVIFFAMFVSIYVSMLLFFTFAKPLALLAVIPWFRPLFKNMAKSILTFALSLIFVAIANALTLFATYKPMMAALEAVEQAGPGADFTVLTELIVFGAFSAFIHLKASTYAAMITGSQVTDFAQTFSTGVATATAATKAYGPKALAKTLAGSGQLGNNVLDLGKRAKGYLGQVK